MRTILPILAVSFAAFSVWTTIRIVNRGKRHGTTFWVVVSLFSLLALYLLSFGPACWIASRTGSGIAILPVVYGPLVKGMTERLDPGPEKPGYIGTTGR